MRKAMSWAGTLMLLSVASGCRADPAKEPTYSSQKPRYAKVVVNEDGSKVLTVVFDESRGTGKGYDRMYVDLNFNGDLTDDPAIKSECEKQLRRWKEQPFP